MAGIFISYRRGDSAAYAGRLGDALFTRYGHENVFLDIDNIEPGVDFVRHIEDAVRTSSVVLVIIGPRWFDKDGRGRLNDKNDFMRLEIASALRSDKYVIPVLVGGAHFPSAESLPEELRALAMRQAISLDDRTWLHDIDRLYRVLDRVLSYLDGAALPDAFDYPAIGERPTAFSDSAVVQLFRWLRTLIERVVLLLVGTQRGNDEPARPSFDDRPDDRPELTEQATPKQHEVFISHAKEDRDLVESIVTALEGAGLVCWVSYRDIPFGTPSWAGVIVDAIATSRLIVVVVSRSSNSSKQVLREVSIADDENIPYIPFRVDDSPLSKDFKFFFSTTQRLDAARLSRTAALNLLTSTVKQRALAAASHTAKPHSS